MAGFLPKSGAESTGYRGLVGPLLLPTWVMVGVFLVIPVALMAIYSFLTKEFRGGVIWDFTLAAYDQFFFNRGLFGDEPPSIEWTYIAIFWRSVWLSLATTALTFAIGFPTAWFIATRPAQQRAMWLFLITIPFWTNLLIRTFAINEVIRNEGILNTALLWLGVIDRPLQIVYTEVAVLIGMTYVYLPLMVLPLYATIERFDMRLLEASYDLYASRWRTLRRVILPIVKPGIVAGSILVFVPSLGAYVTPRILGGGKKMMIGNFIELQFLQGKNWPLGAALSVLLLIIVTAALLVYVRVANRDRETGHG